MNLRQMDLKQSHTVHKEVEIHMRKEEEDKKTHTIKTLSLKWWNFLNITIKTESRIIKWPKKHWNCCVFFGQNVCLFGLRSKCTFSIRWILYVPFRLSFCPLAQLLLFKKTLRYTNDIHNVENTHILHVHHISMKPTKVREIV